MTPKILIIFLVVGLVIGVVYFKDKNKTSQENYRPNLPYSTQVPTTDPSVQLGYKEGACDATELGIEYTLTEGWECRKLPYGGVELKSELFEVVISNLGRGPFCWNPPDSDEKGCIVTNYFKTNDLNLEIYNSKGQDKEIFGAFRKNQAEEHDARTWLSIKYKDMESKKLTASEQKEIFTFLNSIKLNY